MNEPSADFFDLKLMPDWLKQAPEKNPYADYEVRDRGEGRERGGGGRGDQRRGDGRPQSRGGPRREGDRGRGGFAGGGNRGGEKPRRDDRGSAARGPGRERERGGQRDRGFDKAAPAARPAENVQPAPVQITFLPDANCVASIARQIKATNRAYSLFDLARMFLAKPERHSVRITSESADAPLWQAGENGPIGLDRSAVERAAFSVLQKRFYVADEIQRDPPKGNFTNVARHRFTGTLFGPTNYHGYQPALRKLYEERFSRRMSFQDFQREIETVADPALVEKWKDQVRTTRVYRPVPPTAAQTPEEKPNEGEVTSSDAATPTEAATDPAVVETLPITSVAESPEPSSADAPPQETPAEAPTANEPAFESLAEVEQHFRKTHLEALLRSGKSFEISGEESRLLPDRRIAASVRQAWEKERGFPGQMMHYLRVQFSQTGLQLFKHRKRMQFVSAIRPAPFAETGENFSPGIAEILRVVKTTPGCTRAALAGAILGSNENDPELPQKKTALASDLRWLIDAGRVIEFYDGRLEMPLSTEAAAKPEAKSAKGEKQVNQETKAPSEIVPDDAPPTEPEIRTDVESAESSEAAHLEARSEEAVPAVESANDAESATPDPISQEPPPAES